VVVVVAVQISRKLRRHHKLNRHVLAAAVDAIHDERGIATFGLVLAQV
jgi:hypothetical protein